MFNVYNKSDVEYQPQMFNVHNKTDSWSTNLSFSKEFSPILVVDWAWLVHCARLPHIVKPGLTLCQKIISNPFQTWSLCGFLENLVNSSTASSSFSERVYPVCSAISAITLLGSFFIASYQNRRRFGCSCRFQPGAHTF